MLNPLNRKNVQLEMKFIGKINKGSTKAQIMCMNVTSMQHLAWTQHFPLIQFVGEHSPHPLLCQILTKSNVITIIVIFLIRVSHGYKLCMNKNRPALVKKYKYYTTELVFHQFWCIKNPISLQFIWDFSCLFMMLL